MGSSSSSQLAASLRTFNRFGRGNHKGALIDNGDRRRASIRHKRKSDLLNRGKSPCYLQCQIGRESIAFCAILRRSYQRAARNGQLSFRPPASGRLLKLEAGDSRLPGESPRTGGEGTLADCQSSNLNSSLTMEYPMIHQCLRVARPASLPASFRSNAAL
jgi:hypothetical protein